AIEKSSKPAPASKPKVTKEKPSKASTAKPPKLKPTKEKSTTATPLQKTSKGEFAKVRNVKSAFELVDEPDKEPTQHEPELELKHQGQGEEFDMERAIQMSLESFRLKIDEAIRENVKEAVQIAFSGDSDLSKRRRHDTGAFGSSPPPSPQSSAWKKSDTQDSPLSSSKQQSGPYAEQPVDDIPIPDSANISDSENPNSAHLPKSKQRPKWLKPILDDERPATLRPGWVIPPSYIPDAKNNWAKALATTYQAPSENST
ncbi:hypothetical protein Tco_0965194, partial [Tanacetum coccineum]